MKLGAPALTGRWLDLAIVSWRVAPELLRPRLPAGVELDEWDGRHWLSLVGLRFLDLAVGGVPVPLHQEFAQVNLRFYARRVVDGVLRPGVVFVRELVPSVAVTAIARLAVGEPFARAEVRAEVLRADDRAAHPEHVAYAWDASPGTGRLHVAAGGPPTTLERLSLEEFLAERCWGWSTHGGATLEYRVRHARWSWLPAREAGLEGELAATFPLDLSRVLLQPPDHAFIAEGSAVTVEPPLALQDS